MTPANADGTGMSSGSSVPDAHRSDADLDNQLNSELMTAQQGPRAPSGWARALGDTGLDLGGGSGVGGYAFDPDEFDAIVGQWQTILQHAQEYDHQIHVISSVTSAAQDEASTGFTSQAQDLGIALRASHSSLKSYASGYIAKLQGAQKNYQSTEHAVSGSLRDQDPNEGT